MLKVQGQAILQNISSFASLRSAWVGAGYLRLFLLLQSRNCHNGLIPLVLVVTTSHSARNTELLPQKIRAFTDIVSSRVKVLTRLPAVPGLSPSFPESYKYLNIFPRGAEEKECTASEVLVGCNTVLLMIIWALGCSSWPRQWYPAPLKQGYCHDVWYILMCKES